MRLLLALLIGMVGMENLMAQEVLPPPKVVTPLPQAEVIPLPAPRVLVLPAPYPTGYYRRSANEHWQYLSPTTQGFMRPRVLLTPGGPIYAYDGQPFLYLNQEPKAIGQSGTVPSR